MPGYEIFILSLNSNSAVSTSLTLVAFGGGSQAMQGAMTVAIWWASISL